ncbi:hypothetical protein HOY80DRAFT_961582 [Tuber brumale]|nr:hypothetical protein HOY80DRAFT_961582 [Tuber brumale]
MFRLLSRQTFKPMGFSHRYPLRVSLNRAISTQWRNATMNNLHKSYSPSFTGGSGPSTVGSQSSSASPAATCDYFGRGKIADSGKDDWKQECEKKKQEREIRRQEWVKAKQAEDKTKQEKELKAIEAEGELKQKDEKRKRKDNFLFYTAVVLLILSFTTNCFASYLKWENRTARTPEAVEGTSCSCGKGLKFESTRNPHMHKRF